MPVDQGMTVSFDPRCHTPMPEELRARADQIEASVKAHKKAEKERAKSREIAITTYRHIALHGQDEHARLAAAAALLGL